MTMWRPGMLAVCVPGGEGRWYDENGKAPALGPIVDGVYLVTETGNDDGLDWLCFAEFHPDDAFEAKRFRPAVEDRDPCEEEFRTLLKRSKPAQVPAALRVSQAEPAGIHTLPDTSGHEKGSAPHVAAGADAPTHVRPNHFGQTCNHKIARAERLAL